jgi:hypothetical protein
MNNDSLVWAGVPHNSDGVVFQIRLNRGLQRFHVPRAVLEEVFDLERRAMDARQLQLFYLHMDRILVRAGAKRSIASADTVPLKASDFSTRSDRDARPGAMGAAMA